MYSIVITSNSINKTYNKIQSNSKAYRIVIDNYRALKYTNDNNFNIILHDGEGIVVRLTRKHFISKYTLQAKEVVQEWKAYA